MTAVFFGIDWLESGTDLDAPYLQARDPAPGETLVPLASDVQLEVTDDVSDVDPLATVIEMDRGSGWETVFTGGAAQPGFAVTVTPLTHGVGLDYYRYLIDPDVDFALGATPIIRVTEADIIGNLQTQTYSFAVIADVITPYLRAQDPAPLATDVSKTHDIYFEVADLLSDVDVATLTVEVDRGGGSELAYDSGFFQSPYTGSVVEQLESGRKYYEITVHHPVGFYDYTTVEVHVVVDDDLGNTLDTSYTFQSEDTLAPVASANFPTGLDVPVATLVSFDIVDVGSGVDLETLVIKFGTTVVYDWDGIGSPVDGFQAGYRGPSSNVYTIPDGHHVVIDPETNLANETVYTIHVDADDLAGNTMATFSWPFTTSTAPLIFTLWPLDEAMDVPLDTDVSFHVSDDVAVDETTIQVSVNGAPVVVDGVAEPGYGLSITGAPTLLTVVIDPDSPLLMDQGHVIDVAVSDTAGNTSTKTWTFDTSQGLVVSPVLRAAAFDALVKLLWTLPAPEFMRYDLFQLRRSTTTTPLVPGDGKLVYEGLDLAFDDVTVVNGTVYYYTLFVVHRYVNGVPEYVDYDPEASATAKPRAVIAATRLATEYVPGRGEFGTRTTLPVPGARLQKTWSLTSPVDEIRTVAGTLVRAPVNGQILGVRATSVSSTVDIEVPESGIVITLTNVLLLAGLVQNSRLVSGQVIGRTVSGTMSLSMAKMPGRQTINPRHFYTSLESRDGGGS